MNRKQRRAEESRKRKSAAPPSAPPPPAPTPAPSQPTLQDVQESLDSREDAELLGMFHDIQDDPARFSRFAGEAPAAEFLATLIRELTDRNLIFPDSEETTLPEVPCPSIRSDKL